MYGEAGALIEILSGLLKDYKASEYDQELILHLMIKTLSFGLLGEHLTATVIIIQCKQKS